MPNINSQNDRLRYSKRRERADLASEIEAFETWRDTPSIEEAIIRDRIAYLIFRQMNPEIAKCLDQLQK